MLIGRSVPEHTQIYAPEVFKREIPEKMLGGGGMANVLSSFVVNHTVFVLLKTKILSYGSG